VTAKQRVVTTVKIFITLALSPERQSAQMSEIKNGRLDLDGIEHFEM